MKTKKQILNDLKNNGFSILNDYYDKGFCENAKEEINYIIKNKNFVYSKKLMAPQEIKEFSS